MKTVIDKRLEMLLSLVPECDKCADIGTDHGYLGIELLKRGICKQVQFSDISAPSLDKARLHTAMAGLEDSAVFTVADGLDKLTEGTGAVIIAGMGADTILSILEKGREKLGDAVLVLEPNINPDVVREALPKLGYRIADEAMTKDNGRFYTAIRAEKGREEYSRTQILAGPRLMEKKPEALKEYVRRWIKIQTKALGGAENGNDESAAERIRQELDCWLEIQKTIENGTTGGYEKCSWNS